MSFLAMSKATTALASQKVRKEGMSMTTRIEAFEEVKRSQATAEVHWVRMSAECSCQSLVSEDAARAHCVCLVET